MDRRAILKFVGLGTLGMGVYAGFSQLDKYAVKITEERLAALGLIAGDDPAEYEKLLVEEERKQAGKQSPEEINPHAECEKLYKQAFSIINNAKKRYSCHLVEKYPNSKTSWLVRARKMKPYLESAEKHFRNHYEAYTESKVVNLSEADIEILVKKILEKHWNLTHPERKTQALER
jgi:hypothetical protein